jgi:hypothetical protein
MLTVSLQHEAEHCRRQAATAFHGTPEGDFLLRLAGMFEELALQRPSVSEPLPQQR